MGNQTKIEAAKELLFNYLQLATVDREPIDREESDSIIDVICEAFREEIKASVY